MGNEKGFIVTPRHYFDSDIWLDDSPFDIRSAWQDIIQRAQWHQSKRLRSWDQVILERGQLIVSIKILSETWKWSHGKVERYISYLEKTGRIRCAKRHNFSVITICNYDKYQILDNYVTPETESKRKPDDDQTESGRKADDDIQVSKVSKVKKDIKRESESSEDDMEWNDETNTVREHWNENVRPKCIGWTDGDKKSISAWLNKGITLTQITHGIDNYALVIKAKPGKYAWTYAGWSLKHFMQRGLERFMDDSFIASIAKKTKPIFGANNGRPDGCKRIL